MIDSYKVLSSVLSAVSGELSLNGRACSRVEMVNGAQPAWDDCCNGFLYLRIASVYPSGHGMSQFPQPDVLQSGTHIGKCNVSLLAFQCYVGVLRCRATFDQGMGPAAAKTIEAEAEGMLDDMGLVMDALVNTAQTLPGVARLVLERWTPTVVEGGCGGGEQGFYLGIDPCFGAGVPSPL